MLYIQAWLPHQTLVVRRCKMYPQHGEHKVQISFFSIEQKPKTMAWISAQHADQLTFDIFRQGRHMMSKNGCVDGLQVGVAGKLDLVGIKERHEARVQHVPGTSRRAHGPNKLDVLYVLPVQLLPAVIEALQSTGIASCTEHIYCHVMRHSLSYKLPKLAFFEMAIMAMTPCEQSNR